MLDSDFYNFYDNVTIHRRAIITVGTGVSCCCSGLYLVHRDDKHLCGKLITCRSVLAVLQPDLTHVVMLLEYQCELRKRRKCTARLGIVPQILYNKYNTVGFDKSNMVSDNIYLSGDYGLKWVLIMHKDTPEIRHCTFYQYCRSFSNIHTKIVKKRV